MPETGISDKRDATRDFALIHSESLEFRAKLFSVLRPRHQKFVLFIFMRSAKAEKKLWTKRR